MVQISRSRHGSRGGTNYFHIILTGLFCAISFYTGTLSPLAACDCPVTGTIGTTQVKGNDIDDAKIEAIVQQRLEAGKSLL